MLILIIIVFGLFCGWLVGGLIFSLVAGDGIELRSSGLLGSILGAVIVLAIWGVADGRKTA